MPPAPTQSRPRSPCWTLHACGAAGAAAFGGIAWLNQGRGGIALGAYLALMAVAWSALGLAWWATRSADFRHSLGTLLAWGCLFRLIGFLGDPVMEDDYFRYLWDGRQFALHGNPYASPPSDHFQDEGLDERFESILGRINYPHIPTIYAPALQYAFVTGYWIAPGALWPLKLILIAADLATAVLLLRLGSPRSLLLYLWCPLLIQETAFTAHPDSLGACFAVAAAVASARSRSVLAGVCIGLAAGTKFPGLLIAPFLLRASERRGWVALGATLAVLYSPFWLQGSLGDWPTLARFAGEWEFNSGGFALLQSIAGAELAGPLAAVTTLVGLGWIWSGDAARRAERLDLAYGWFFLWSAVVQPWYLLWLLPWVALRPSPPGVAALVAVSLSYLTHMHLGDGNPDLFGHPGWVRPLEYALVGLAAAGWWLARSRRRPEAAGETLPSR